MGERLTDPIHNGRVTRRSLIAGAGALGAAAFLAACGSDDKSSSTTAAPGTTAGGATTAAGSATTAAGGATTAAGGATTAAGGTGGGATGDIGSQLASLLKVDAATSGKGQTLDMGAVLALTGTGSFYGKTMCRGLDLAAKHIKAAGGPKFKYTYLDHKSGDAAAGVAAITELASKGIHAKFASYVDDLGAMLKGTAATRSSPSTAAAARASSARPSRTSGARGRSRRTTHCPGCSSGRRRSTPTPRPSASSAGTSATRTTATVKEDILKKIADGGYTHNGLYELVTVGNQDFSQVLPKIKANEPDILLVSNYGQDPGSFANQASTADLKAVRIGFEFTPDGVERVQGNVRLRRLDVRLRLLRRGQPDERLGQDVRRRVQEGVRRGSRLLRRELLREHVRHVGGHPPGAARPAATPTTASTCDKALQSDLTWSACTAATSHHRHLHPGPDDATP